VAGVRAPPYSVVLLTLVELLGFAVMTPKTWRRPESESLSYFALSILKHLFSAAALSLWSLVTALYPLATALMAAAFAGMIFLRRRQCAWSHVTQ
jgi:hypothetical protein